jgi:hypothetical protein
MAPTRTQPPRRSSPHTPMTAASSPESCTQEMKTRLVDREWGIELLDRQRAHGISLRILAPLVPAGVVR